MDYQIPLQPLDAHNRLLRDNVHPPDWVNPSPASMYNLVVIGAGTAGLVTASIAAGMGARVALIERGLMGGDCLNVGCVPSKALLAVAHRLAAIRRCAPLGILETADVSVDFSRVMERMRRIRATISHHDSAARYREMGIDVFLGQANFASDREVHVGDAKLRFKKTVIATGARASVPPIRGLETIDYLTNESLFTLTDLPASMVVVGGGPIGCEISQAFARFGSRVTLVHRSDRLLPNDAPDASAAVHRSLLADGVDVMLDSTVVTAGRRGSEKMITVEHSARGDTREIVCQAVMISVGRRPNVDGLALQKAGVEFDPERGVMVDDRLRTSNRRIYAAGDICSRFKFTHAADFMARTVVRNALFHGRGRVSELTIPWCTYTDPEVAHVGLTPWNAHDESGDLDAYDQPVEALDRAKTEGDELGFFRVYCRKGKDKILGATIVGPHAGDMIGQLTLAMQHGIGVKSLGSVIHPYPTLGEGIRRLGDQYNRGRLTPMVKRLSTKWFDFGRKWF
jgi:pyruvate/2-oxoglutarate dehydrogenase complex dihydrolipoamide dehydrogenase (E3) component